MEGRGGGKGWVERRDRKEGRGGRKGREGEGEGM